jgi:hypothetical protein
MCPQGPTRASVNAALGLALAAAMLAVPTVARAGDDDSNVPIDTQVVRSIMEGLGLKRPGEAEINYQERAPLVIPPSRDLPPPLKPGAAIANDPAWPKDPDIERAKLERAQQKNRDVNAEVQREENPLPPGQLAPGAKGRRVARRGYEPDNPSGNNNGDEHYRLSPSELGYHGGLFGAMFDAKDDSASARFTGEPRRTSLTNPPAGYQTPSPDQPYGLGKEATMPKAAKPYATHGEVGSDSH